MSFFSFQDNSPYGLLVDDRQGLFLLLVRKDWGGSGKAFDPLWAFECGDHRSLEAALRWCLKRQSQWDDWGRMAEELDRDILATLIVGMMEAQPIAESAGILIKPAADPKEVMIGEMLMLPQGLQQEILYRHRFSTAGKRRRFLAWFFANSGTGVPGQLINLLITGGPVAIAPVLERIAAGKTVDLALPLAA